MWKNLYLVFCFLESANNNVSENQTTVQPETKSERSVLIEIEEEQQPFLDQKNIQNQKCFFPPFLSHSFLSLSGPRV